MTLEALGGDSGATSGADEWCERFEVDVVFDEGAEDEGGGGAPGSGEVFGGEGTGGASESGELTAFGSLAEGEGEGGAVFDEVNLVSG